MKNWVSKFGGWLPLLIVLIAIIQKGCYIKSFSSSGDDNLVASSIIYGKKPFNESKVRITINDQGKPTYHSLPKKLARKLDSTGNLMPVLRQLHFLFPLYAVPNETTYAPLQFFITAFLVNNEQFLFTNIVMGRIPSLIIYFLGLLLFLYIMVRYFKGAENQIALNFSLLILAFSYEHIIYSIQMESYAIGVFGLIFLIFSYLYYTDKYLLNEKSSFIIIGIICSIMLLMQYQLLIFSFAAVCSIIYLSINKNISYTVIAKRIFFSGVFFLIFFIPVFFMFLSKHTNHVATHLIGYNIKVLKYWFPGHKISDWKDGVFYFLKFFGINSFEVFRYMTMTFKPFTYLEGISFAISFLLLAIGFFHIFSVKNDNYIKKLNIFLFFSFLFWIAVFISGRMALTPDRHSLIFLPVFIFLIYFGCVRITNLLDHHIKFPKIIGMIFISVALVLLLISTNDFLKKRLEPFFLFNLNEKTISNNSLIITQDRIMYLFSKKNNSPVYLECDDLSRRGWLNSPKQKDFIPDKIYFLMRIEEFPLLGDERIIKDRTSILLKQENFICNLPNEIIKENKKLNDLFLNQGFKKKIDTMYSVNDDELHEIFLRKRNTRIVVFEKSI